MPGALFPNPHNRKYLQMLASVPGGGQTHLISEAVFSPLKDLHLKYASCLGVQGLLEAIHVPFPPPPALAALTFSPCAPNPGDCGMWLSPALSHRSSHESRGSRYVSGPQTALTCSEAECSWPSGFQMLWPENSTCQGAQLLEPSGVCLPPQSSL